MKKIVYVIISVMAFTFFVNLTAVAKESSIKVESANGIIEINPLY